MPILAHSQITPDPQRDFGQGQVAMLPDTTEYIGDLPHYLDVETNFLPDYSLSGWFDLQTDWFNATDPHAAGIRRVAPGLFFEGIPFLLGDERILDEFPMLGTVEYQDLPAEAWWGPAGITGAVQIRAPLVGERGNQASAWGGSDGMGGAQAFYQDSSTATELNFQHDILSGDTPMDNLALLQKTDWLESGGFSVKSGFLGFKSFLGDQWYAGFADLGFSTPNFQSFRLRPYLQYAQTNSESATSGGVLADYRFDMAGLVESETEGGLSRTNFVAPEPEGTKNSTTGYLQNTEVINVLDSLTVDGAARLDMSDLGPSHWGLLAGLQYKMEPFNWVGDFSRSDLPGTPSDLEDLTLGAKTSLSEQLYLDARYIHEVLWNTVSNGVRWQAQWTLPLELGFCRALELQAGQKALAGPGGAWTTDNSAKCQLDLDGSGKLWFRGRYVTLESFLKEAGGTFSAVPGWDLFATASNVGNYDISWPRPGLTGWSFRAGLQASL